MQNAKIKLLRWANFLRSPPWNGQILHWNTIWQIFLPGCPIWDLLRDSLMTDDFLLAGIKINIILLLFVSFQRNDFLQLLLSESKVDGDTILTDDEIFASAITFLLAGYETTSNALAFTLYLLALHEDVQERLYQEIKDNFNEVSLLYLINMIWHDFDDSKWSIVCYVWFLLVYLNCNNPSLTIHLIFLIMFDLTWFWWLHIITDLLMTSWSSFFDIYGQFLLIWGNVTPLPTCSQRKHAPLVNIYTYTTIIADLSASASAVFNCINLLFTECTNLWWDPETGLPWLCF